MDVVVKVCDHMFWLNEIETRIDDYSELDRCTVCQVIKMKEENAKILGGAGFNLTKYRLAMNKSQLEGILLDSGEDDVPDEYKEYKRLLVNDEKRRVTDNRIFEEEHVPVANDLANLFITREIIDKQFAREIIEIEAVPEDAVVDLNPEDGWMSWALPPMPLVLPDDPPAYTE